MYRILRAYECGYTRQVGMRFTLAMHQGNYSRDTDGGGWYIAGINAGHSEVEPYPGHINIYRRMGCDSHFDFAEGRTYQVVGHDERADAATRPDYGMCIVLLQDVTHPAYVRLPEGL